MVASLRASFLQSCVAPFPGYAITLRCDRIVLYVLDTTPHASCMNLPPTATSGSEYHNTPPSKRSILIRSFRLVGGTQSALEDHGARGGAGAAVVDCEYAVFQADVFGLGFEGDLGREG